MVQLHRDSEAFLALIKEWKGILISDDYGIYRSWEYGRQTCLAHLIREARALAESSDQNCAACGKRLLKLFGDICDLVGSPLSTRAYQNLYKRFYHLVMEYGDLTVCASNLVTRALKEFEEITLCLRDPRINSTNNFAERQIRSAVCKRKISIGSAAEKGERWIERSLTVRKSCALQNHSYYKTLVDAIKAATLHRRPCLYWIRKAIVRSRALNSPA